MHRSHQPAHPPARTAARAGGAAGPGASHVRHVTPVLRADPDPAGASGCVPPAAVLSRPGLGRPASPQDAQSPRQSLARPLLLAPGKPGLGALPLAGLPGVQSTFADVSKRTPFPVTFLRLARCSLPRRAQDVRFPDSAPALCGCCGDTLGVGVVGTLCPPAAASPRPALWEPGPEGRAGRGAGCGCRASAGHVYRILFCTFGLRSGLV